MVDKFDLYNNWKELVLKPYKESNPSIVFSDIFCFGNTSDYDSRKRTIMIVGQEPNNYGYYGQSSLDQLIRFPKEYMDRQLLGTQNSYEYNKSPFWMMFRKYYELGYNVIWNNLDKVHKVDKGLTVRLSEADELSLNVCFGIENKTLLQQEIEIVKPNLIVFVTGPSYSVSMASSLGIDSEVLYKKYRPTPN